MKSRINREAREISISELWWYVISKWKWLVIGMVVGAILLGAYGVYSAYRANESAKANVPKEYTMEDLTPEEQAEVKELISDYERYQEEANKLENNYLMNLKYDNATHYLVTYYIDTDYSYNYMNVQENYTETLVSMYKTYVYSDEVQDKIMGMNIDGLEYIDLTYIYNASSEANVVKIAVFADEAWAENITDNLCETFEAYYTVASELVGEHRLVKISKDKKIAYSDTILAGRNHKNAIVYELFNDVETTKSQFTEKQVAVYEKEITESGENAIMGNEGKQDLNSLINNKYIIVGAVCGMVLGAVIAAAILLFGKTIKSIREISQVYSIEIIGKILRDDVCNKIAIKKINGIKTTKPEVEQKEYVVETIINKCKNENISRLAVCSTIEGMEERLADIIKHLKEIGVDCKVVNNINCDKIALSTAVECRNLIIAETLNESVRNEFEAELEACDNLSINILGMIVII